MKLRKLIFPVYFTLAFTVLSVNTSGNTIHTGNETAWLQTDRNIYIAGENVFFKLYLLDANTHKLSHISKIAYLVLRDNYNKPVVRIKLKLERGTAYGSFALPDSLKSGTCQITVFTNWMRNSGESSFFTKEIFVANRFDKELPALNNLFNSSGNVDIGSEQTPLNKNSLAVLTDKTEYNKREKICLSLEFPKNIPGDTARLSISVFEIAPGIINGNSNDKYLIHESENSVSSINPDERFLPEMKGEIIQGHVIDQETNEVVANKCVFLSANDTMVNLQYTFTDSGGMFRFQLNDYYYGKDLYFSVKEIPAGKKFKIIPEDKFELNNNFKPIPTEGSQALKAFILKSQDIVTIQKAYEAENAIKTGKQSAAALSFFQLYYKTNYCIYPADFVPLNDFAEIAKEILPPQFSLNKHSEGYTAYLADESRHMYFDQEPLVFLDGVYIDNVNQVMKLGSDKVQRVELVCSSYNFGEFIFPGILAVFSKTYEIRNIQPNESTIRIQLQDFHAYSDFKGPAYSIETESSQPDFRQHLYWNPTIEFSGSHYRLPEFYASDHSGDYMIGIEGITSAGIPLHATTMIRVK